MSFVKYDENGKIKRNRVTIDCQKAIEEGEEIRVEQSHKDEVNINNIVKRHGIDLIAKTSAMTQFRYDDVTGNDFQESMNAILTAQESFGSLPSEVRKKFDNDPVKFMDFAYNPDNHQAMIDYGLADPESPPPEPIQVVMVNSETGTTVTTETPPESQPA